MQFEDWFNFGQSRKVIEIYPDSNECSFGYEINYPSNIFDVDIYDEKYIPIRSIKNFIKIGIQNSWIKKEGCIKHELNGQVVKLTDGRNISSFNKTHKGICIDDSSPEIVNYLIDEANKISKADLFFDIGVGHGIPIKVALNKYSFVGGIDIDLNNVNITKNKNPKSEVFVADAFDFKINDLRQHLYMFNPFDNYVLDAFLKNNNAIIKKTGSLILYHNNYQADHLFKLFGYTAKLENVEGINIYELK